MDLKSLLDEKAEEMRLDRRIPSPVLRRARRRRAANAALAGAVTVGLAVGAVVGIRALLQETTSGPGVTTPAAPTEASYPFIYPPTQEELEVTQEQVAQGSMPMWTEPEGVAILFAVNVMGWEMDDVQTSVRGDEPIIVVITNPALNEAAGATSDLRTAVYLARVPGSEDPPMYAVLAAQAEGMEVEPLGPDTEFGSDGTVGFRGRLSAGPDQAIVVLTVEQSDGRHAETLAGVEADGTFEISVGTPAGIGPQSLISIAVTDRERPTLALTSSRIASPIAGEGESGASEPQLALPRPVTDMRNAIWDAASLRDLGPLRSLIPDEGFTFTFGGETDPIRYWKRLESEGVPIFDRILPAVLESEPGFDRGVFVWPAQALEDPATWDAADIEALSGIHTEEEIRAFQEASLYYGWRLGIDRDGTWVFFVAGD